MGAIPEFPKRLAYKVTPIPKNNFRIVQWTRYGCNLITPQPVDFTTALESLTSATKAAYCDQVVGMIDHKIQAVFRHYGEKPRESRS